MNIPTNEIGLVTWEKTWQAIRALLPNATHCTPASLKLAAEKAGMPMVVVDASKFPEAQCDAVLLRKLLTGAKQDEPVIVVTDCSFREGWMPFGIRLSEADAFAGAYRRLTDECVISGLDVVLVCPDTRFMVLYYHEGQVATVGR